MDISVRYIRCDEAYERRKAKYTELPIECRERGYRTWRFPIEVSAICVPTDGSNRDDWQRQAKDCPKTEPSCRACV